MKYRWNVSHPEPAAVRRLSRELGVSGLLAGMLIRRGLGDPSQASAFLNPTLDDMHDPTLLMDMERVVTRIFAARDRREKVLIYGDYDVDGITSTVILKRALEMLGLEVGFYLPRRLEEGYGLKSHVIERAHREGYALIITADSGIRAFGVCQVARTLGVDLVVTDHHAPDETLPEAFAIINPRRPDCAYPDKDLAAVGVVFKLIQALFARTGRAEVVPHFLKLVAIGTVADLVPLVGENRIFTKFGLEGLARPQNLGLRSLLKSAGVSGCVSPTDVGFKVAPRINAVTRMGGGREVVDLFSLQDSVEADRVVEEMHSKNLLRRETEQEIVTEIESRFETDPSQFQGRLLVVSGEGWHRGVIGIVASRVVEKFYRPALVVSVDTEGCQASGRSIPGFHLLDALTDCRHLLDRFGGHAQAVGCSMPKEVLPELAERLDAYARSHMDQDILSPSLEIDAQLAIGDVTASLLDQVEKMAPFGNGNPLPVFVSRHVKVTAGPFILKDKHLKFKIGSNGSALEAIWWRHGEMAHQIRADTPLDVVYRLSRDVYQGVEKLLLTVQDMDVSSAERVS